MGRPQRLLVAAIISVSLLVALTLWRTASIPSGKKEIRSSGDEKQYMTFDHWLNGTFTARSFYPYWISDSEYAYTAASGAIMRKNIKTRVESELLAAASWENVTNFNGYYISADSEYVSVLFGRTDGYAHYVRTFGIAVFETSTGKRMPNLPEEGVQKIKWDPAGHKLAYVKGYNVYIITDFGGVPTQITSDGKENVVFNGISDWLHWIEITDDDALLWWSPSGTYLAFAKIDEDNVKNFDFSIYGGDQYPAMISFPYPKPGTPIPKTSMWIIDSSGLASDPKEIKPSSVVTGWGEYYLNSVLWRSDTILTPTWKNRFENHSVSETCEAPSWTCTHVTEMEMQNGNGWLGHYKPAKLVRLPKSNEYVTVLSNGEGFPHIVVVDVETNTKDWRTSGSFEVTDTWIGDQPIFHYDETNDWIYFTSTEVELLPGTGMPRIRHLWRVKAHGENRHRTCISCDLNEEYKNRCNWVRPTFSPGGTYFVVNCEGTGNGVPVSVLYEVEPGGDLTFVSLQENNSELQNNLQKFYFRTKEYGEITLPDDDGNDIYYYALYKPPNFDPKKKYPMLVQVYSGPGYQQVVEKFSVSWRDFVSGSLDVIVMSFDGRGTGFRGDRIMHKIYRKLGQYEPIDQIAAARKLAKEKPYIDADRIAIWGWSYGGYVTTRTIAEDSEGVFKCGFAVAPVTDWQFYHTIYTERYMGSPFNDNEEGYNVSTTMQKYYNYKKHQYFLFHGTADENVHFQNSARLNMALVQNEVPFSSFYAGDDDHGMRKVKNDYRNLYKMITRHMCRCFDLDKPKAGVMCGETSEAQRRGGRIGLGKRLR